MKTLPLLVALTVAGLAPARGQEAAKGGDTEKALKVVEDEWGAAIVKRDGAAMNRILTDDYTLTTPEGRLATKAQILKSLQAPTDPAFVIKGVGLEAMKTRVFGDTAVVSSRFTLKVLADGRTVETPFRHTDVFVKRQGGWRCVTRHATRIRQSYGHDPGSDDGN